MSEETALVPVDTEIAQIETTMRENRSAYDSDTDMRARYRDLLSRRDGGAPDADTHLLPAPASHVRADLSASWVGLELSEAWDRGGFDGMLQRVQDAARSIIDPIANSRDLVASFEALPASIRHSVMKELANGPRSFVPSVSEQGVKRFCSVREQAELAAEWGFSAPRKIGSIRARMWAVIDSLDERTADEFCAWCDGVPPKEWKIILRGLTR